MRSNLQRLIRNGTSTAVCLHKKMLTQTGMRPGDTVAVDLLEDNTIRIRPATLDDLRPSAKPRQVLGASESVVQ